VPTYQRFEDLPVWQEAITLAEGCEDFLELAESCSRQLRAWADSLQNSDIAGQRHLNDRTRANYQKRKARESGAAHFQQLLAQHLPADHPLRSGNPNSQI
jgi:hypothetical protein